MQQTVFSVSPLLFLSLRPHMPTAAAEVVLTIKKRPCVCVCVSVSVGGCKQANNLLAPSQCQKVKHLRFDRPAFFTGKWEGPFDVDLFYLSLKTLNKYSQHARFEKKVSFGVNLVDL